MTRFLRFSPLWLGVIALVVFIIYINLPNEETQQRLGGGATPVITEVLEQKAFAITIEALGTATANESINLTSRVADIVTDIRFEDGQQVQVGDVLLTLDSRQQQARVNEITTNLSEAKRQLQRIRNLAKTNSASKQLLDEQKARVDVLTAQLEVVNANLAETQIKAPFSGVLGQRNISLGAYLKAGEIITTLDDIATIKLDFSVAEKHLPSISNGQQVFAKSVAYPGEVFTGEIFSIDSRIDPVTRSVGVRTKISNATGKIKPGMLLTVTLQKEVLDTLVLDEKALVPIEEKQFVFVVKEDKAVQTEVQIGARRPGQVQILSGISAGAEVITQGTLRVRNGSTVKVLNRAGE
jgi:membrane fusion protein (multidrug efflux system)